MEYTNVVPSPIILIISILFLVLYFMTMKNSEKNKYNDAVPFLIVIGSLILFFAIGVRLPVDPLMVLMILFILDFILITIYKYITRKINWLMVIVFVSFMGLSILGSSSGRLNIIGKVLGFIFLCVIIYFFGKLSDFQHKYGRTVYISHTGKVYHTKSYCNGIHLNISIREKEAIDKGYVKCSRCK